MTNYPDNTHILSLSNIWFACSLGLTSCSTVRLHVCTYRKLSPSNYYSISLLNIFYYNIFLYLQYLQANLNPQEKVFKRYIRYVDQTLMCDKFLSTKNYFFYRIYLNSSGYILFLSVLLQKNKLIECHKVSVQDR